jgi:uncharacterized spore protein YtfJ
LTIPWYITKNRFALIDLNDMKKGGNMKTIPVFMVIVLSLTAVISSVSAEDIEEASLESALERFRTTYSTELVIGTPLEINGLKIIPLATVGIGFGPYAARDETLTGAAGGILIPIGVIVVSGQDVRIIRVSKGFLEQVVSALAPVVLQFFDLQQPTPSQDDKIREIITEQGKPIQRENFVFAYWKIIFSLWIVWFILALLIGKFLPHKVAEITAIFQYHYVQISLFGLVGYGIMMLLAAIFTLTIIGIPLTFAALIITCVIEVFGTAGLALFVGQESAKAFKYHYSEMRLLIIGGILFGLLGMIPLFGVIIWAIIGVLGFGAILKMQWESLQQTHI